jgi:outer membrane protein OmpA-like peptidoglycan-associated protein
MRIITFIIMCLSTCSLMAQGLFQTTATPVYNFVPNPGFEILKSNDPCGWNQKGQKYMTDNFSDWSCPTETTPDILSLRVAPDCWANPKKHSATGQKPKSGDVMMGMKIQGKGGTPTHWHEYLGVKLDSTLLPGVRYYAEIWVQRSSRAARGSNNVGFLFLDSVISTNNRLPLYFTPQINAENVLETRGNQWKKVSGVFEADRELNYLYIGNFYPDEQTEVKLYPEGEGGAYYYFDDVLVRRATPLEKLSPAPKVCVPPPPKVKIEETASTVETELSNFEFEVGNVIELRNIYFEFDKAVLLPESKNELDMLMHMMEDYPHMEIEISGHTDNIGSDAYNQKLSEERAKAVVDYLIKEKVSSKRLTYKGFGASKPIDTNETEVGRQENRRVEFRVVKN